MTDEDVRVISFSKKNAYAVAHRRDAPAVGAEEPGGPRADSQAAYGRTLASVLRVLEAAAGRNEPNTDVVVSIDNLYVYNMLRYWNEVWAAEDYLLEPDNDECAARRAHSDTLAQIHRLTADNNVTYTLNLRQQP